MRYFVFVPKERRLVDNGYIFTMLHENPMVMKRKQERDKEMLNQIGKRQCWVFTIIDDAYTPTLEECQTLVDTPQQRNNIAYAIDMSTGKEYGTTDELSKIFLKTVPAMICLTSGLDV